MSNQTNDLQIQHERDKLAAVKRRQAAKNLEQLSANKIAWGVSHIEEDDYVNLGRNPEKTSTRDVVFGDSRINFSGGGITHVVNGQKMSAESAFTSFNWAAYVAGALHMYHSATGWEGANSELFLAILTNCLQIYGPAQDASPSAVAACAEHIADEELIPFEVMRKASIAIKTDAPSQVYSDAVILGVTGMVADTITGSITIPEHEDLAIRATEAFGNTLTVAVSKPMKAMEEIIADIGKYDVQLADVQTQLQNSVDSGSPPEIKETNPHRRLTKVPGLMSDEICVTSKHGYYQRALACCQKYLAVKPEVMVVPGYTIGVSGSYDSMGSVSRVIPLPPSSEHYSLLLYSICDSYEDGLRSLANTEIRMKNDPDYREHVGNARSVIHAPFEDAYDKMRRGQGLTPRGLEYISLWDQGFVGTSDLLKLQPKGRFDNHPVLVRATDFFQARKKSLEGECIIIDPPSMTGLYFTPVFISKYFAEGTHSTSGALKQAKGFYVLRAMPDKTESLYSSWIEKYIFAHLAGSLLGGGVREKILTGYMAGYQKGRQGTQLVARIMQDLRYCYDDISPTLTKIVMLTPGYSATKAFKNRTIFCDFEAEDHNFEALLIDEGMLATSSIKEIVGEEDQQTDFPESDIMTLDTADYF